MSLTTEEFQEFRVLLKEIAGIDLGDNKQYLVTTRVRKILEENNMASLSELTQRIKRITERQLRQRVIDAMTTNETFWFRDIYPFEYLKSTIFPEIQQRKTFGAPRIWCAACSSGQEPYSISMTVAEYAKAKLGAGGFSVDIQATDLSSVILEQAKQGCYDKLAISRGMSDQRLRQFFTVKGANEWQINAELKRCVKFRSLNLQDSFVSMGKFDLVFCRNVLIYFNAELKEDILRRIHATLKPGGYLFLGSSEGLAGAADMFKMIHCNPGVIYQAL